MGQPVYSIEFKKAAVQKLLNRGSRSVGAILQETGVSSPALYRWKDELAYNGSMKQSPKRPQDRSPQEKLKLMIEYEKLSEDDRGEFLRKQGLHAEHLSAWNKQMETALGQTKSTQSERAQDQRKIKELERELKRKDKALAEATALLILKKKAHLIWGTGDEE